MGESELSDRTQILEHVASFTFDGEITDMRKSWLWPQTNLEV